MTLAADNTSDKCPRKNIASEQDLPITEFVQWCFDLTIKMLDFLFTNIYSRYAFYSVNTHFFFLLAHYFIFLNQVTSGSRSLSYCFKFFININVLGAQAFEEQNLGRAFLWEKSAFPLILQNSSGAGEYILI